MRMSAICLDSRTQVFPLRRTIQVHLVGSGDMTHRLVIFKHKQRFPLSGDMCVCWSIPNTVCYHLVRHESFCLFELGVAHEIFPCWRPHTSITVLQKVSAEIPSNRRRASDEISYASVQLCETLVCFLQDQLVGTNVWLPKMHNTLS